MRSKSIYFEKFGKVVVIQKDDWDGLRRRFDPKRATKSVDGDGDVTFTIRERCPLCDHEGYYDSPECPSCPFGQFYTLEDCGEIGCTNFLNKLFRTVYFSMEGLFDVSWTGEYDRRVRRQLRTIQREMERIENEQ